MVRIIDLTTFGVDIPSLVVLMLDGEYKGRELHCAQDEAERIGDERKALQDNTRNTEKAD